MKRSCRKMCRTLLPLFGMLLAVAFPARGEPVRKILILPFTVNAEKDLSFLKKGVHDMLTSRLAREGKVSVVGAQEAAALLAGVSGPVDEKAALEIAEAAAADLVVLGSLTVFGESISTDARCMDAGEKKTLVAFSQAGKNQGDVITHINAFARQVNTQVFGRKTVDRKMASEAGAAPDRRRHPEKIWQENRGQALVYGTRAEGGQASFGVWKSRKFKGEITGLAVADVDGDGKNEAVTIQGSSVVIHRYEAGRFAKVAEIAEPSYHRFFSVDAADINRNGVAEIYVTNLPVNHITMRSFVLEWNGRRFEKILDGANWYYRVVEIPGRGKVLMGQERGMTTDTFGENELFAGGVYELLWKNRSLQPQERQLLPRGVNVYGFAIGDVLNNGAEQVAALTPRDFIVVADRSGQVEWTSDERYGGKDTYLELKGVRQEKDTRGDDESPNITKVFLPQRLHIADLDEDGKNELLAVKNHDATGRFLDQTRFYKSGHIECLTWDAIGMRLKWKTHKTGYISDYVVNDIDNDGKEEIVFAVVLRSGFILENARSYIASLALQ